MSISTTTIHSTTQVVASWLGRSAIYSVLSLAQNPHRSVGKRVTSQYWLDTDELELRFITGTYADVVVIDREVIPNGTVADAQAFARFHLLGEEVAQ